MSSAAGAPTIRNRAIRLVETFFAAQDNEATRRAVFNSAFDGVSPDPRPHLTFSEALAPFAAQAVDYLLAYGCALRGRHSLSLLLTTMAEIRGRQPDPDFYDLPKLLDAQCALPTRAEEQRHLTSLIEASEKLARLYAPLEAIAQLSSPVRQTQSVQLLDQFPDTPGDLALLIRHESPKTETRDYHDILTAFTAVRRAALLGAPGSGKSTTLRKLAVDLAQRAQQDPHSPLPLLVTLGNWRGETPLTAFIAETAAPEIGWALAALSHARRLVLLLDGLNEIPTAGRAAKAADVLKLQGSLDPSTPLVVSCRREDYTGDLALGLDTLTLEPLSPPRIRAAVRQWVSNARQPVEKADRFFWQLAGDPGLAAVLKTWQSAGADEDLFWAASSPNQHEAAFKKTSGGQDELWSRHIPNPRSLMRLASNPFMLTMLFQVWAAEKKEELPRNRGDLFRRFILRLLKREKLSEPDAALLLTKLAALAWKMQREKTTGEEFGVLTVVSRAAALAMLGETMLKHALDGTLLEETGDGELRFRHQLLQEYFTAKALQSRLSETPAALLWPAERWWERTGWEETSVLLAGFFPEDCSTVIRWLAEAQPEVAAQCIEESGAAVPPELPRHLGAAWSLRLTGGQPEARAAIGRALGRLRLDTRPGVGLRKDGVPDIDWVEIPAGEFIYQEGERRKTGSFSIARYPVTNAQYQAFLDASDGYGEDGWWPGLTNPDRTPGTSAWTESNHPRERVSWPEAMAFCAWLGHRLGSAGEVRLPTEWEWERAARGTDGRVYPWGNEYKAGYANIAESNLKRTTAVGLYPEGASSEGVLDLSGNLWEWCLNEYEKPKRTQPGGRESRVLRGGSWSGPQENARASFRDHYLPGYRGYYVGFRVVCSSPIR